MVSLLLPVIYLAFISLGLPDSLLGSAWPVMYQELGTSVSAAGIISMIISAGTIVSSLNSDRLNTRFGTGKVTAVSVLTTAVALFGFSISHSFWALCLWGIPYGLGAGSVDAALNNYVALHYKARHMSWLHCMWGVGCSTGPVVMSWAISHLNWNKGYLIISIFQIVLTLVLFLSLPLWQKPAGAAEEDTSVPAERSFSSLIRVPGVKEVLICFFCYCAVESTAGMWAASYCTLFRGIDAQRAASWASLFYIGITNRRFICRYHEAERSEYDSSGTVFHRRWCGSDAAAVWRFPSFYRPDPDRTWLCADLSFHHSRDTGKLRCRLKPGNHRHPDGLCLRRNLPDAAGFRCSRPAYFLRTVSGIPDGHFDSDGCNGRADAPRNGGKEKFL